MSQRIRLHHPPPRRPQHLRDRTARARHRAEERHPEHNTGGHFRIRDDTTDAGGGKATLRRAGRLHHICLGAQHARTLIRMPVHDLDVTVINRDTGEIIRDLTLDPERDYQPLGRRPGPPPGGKKGGMKKGYKFPPKYR
jgi:hypothetical protein